MRKEGVTVARRFLALCLVVLLVAVAGALAGCGKPPAEGGQPQAQPKTVTIGINPDWQSFDPARTYEPYGAMVIKGCYDTLVTFEGSNTDRVVGALAENWEISPDGKQYTFHLNKVSRFASGKPVTAEDVRFSLMRLKNVKGNPSFLAGGIASVEAPAADTVVISLSEPDASFLAKLATAPFSVVDKEQVVAQGGTDAEDADKTDRAQNWLDTHSAGSGPFVLTEYVPNDRVVLQKNEKYWGSKPAGADTIVLKVIKDSNTQMVMLQKGDIDLAMNLSADQIGQIKGDPQIKIVQGKTLDIFFLLMNNDPKIGGPVANKLVQQAIRYALDYEGILKLAGENSIQCASVVPVGLLGALDSSRAPKRDLEKARELLRQAGYPDGFKATCDVIANLSIDGISLLTLAEKVQADLREVGIDVELTPSELSVALERYRSGKEQMGVWEWTPDYPDSNAQLAFLPGEVVGLRAGWKAEMNPALTELGKRARTETDDAARAELFRQIQEKLLEEGPWAVMVQAGVTVAARSEISGVTLNPAITMFLCDLSR